MTMTEPGGVFLLTFLIRASYSASVVGAARNVVGTLKVYLDGAKNAHETPKKFSTNAQRMELTNIKLQRWCNMNSKTCFYDETPCFLLTVALRDLSLNFFNERVLRSGYVRSNFIELQQFISIIIENYLRSS